MKTKGGYVSKLTKYTIINIFKINDIYIDFVVSSQFARIPSNSVSNVNIYKG